MQTSPKHKSNIKDSEAEEFLTHNITILYGRLSNLAWLKMEAWSLSAHHNTDGNRRNSDAKGFTVKLKSTKPRHGLNRQTHKFLSLQSYQIQIIKITFQYSKWLNNRTRHRGFEKNHCILVLITTRVASERETVTATMKCRMVSFWVSGEKKFQRNLTIVKFIQDSRNLTYVFHIV